LQQLLVTLKILIMRIAVSQFATSLNVQESLAICIRAINEAAACEPALIVLPEFCNTLFCNVQPSYSDHNQAWNEALTADGAFIQSIAEQAKKHHCYIVLNVTLRRDLFREHQDGSIKSNISVTSCLISPLGDLIHQTDRSRLTGNEQEYFTSTKAIAEVVKTPLGKIGLLSGSDSMTFEASRELALDGAQLLCHSMNAFTLDQSDIHAPSRASENKVFLASANKVGSLITQEQNPEETKISQDSVPQKYLSGVGQSQIISPNGKVLAKLNDNLAGYIFADIDMKDGDTNNKNLRPELYTGLTALINKSLTTKPAAEYTNKAIPESQAPVTVNAAIFATYKSNDQAIEDVCHYIENNLSDIIQLPELFFIADKKITHNPEQKAQIESLSMQLINQISAKLRPFQYVCTSLIIEGMHQAVILSEHGLFAIQPQLHYCQRYSWTALGDKVNIIELPLEQGSIKVAMLTADDANIPEIVKIAALNNIHVLLVPFDIQEPFEVEYCLLSRAAEHRICLIAASREKSFTIDVSTDNDNNNAGNKKKLKSQKSTGFIASLITENNLLTQWKSGKFTGFINPPLVKHQQGKITKALIHPIASENKFIATHKWW
jgi:predicted amidohydrolase